jgi:predicted Zn-dependent protease with MMP-like domain
MPDEFFEDIVYQTIDELPDSFKQLMDNIDVVIEDWPSRSQLSKLGLKNKESLLGLYEGIPLTERDSSYKLVLPDRIYIFKKPIVKQYRTHRELKLGISKVVKHEIAHYFGLDDQRLRELEEDY